MKKIVTSGLILLVVSTLVYVLASFVINNFSIANRRASQWMIPYLQRKGGQEKMMFNDWTDKKKPDIIVLGSSHAYRGYDPREFDKRGLALFNGGTSSQHSLASYLLFENYFAQSSAPLYIIDLYEAIYSGEGMECTTRMIENVKDDHTAFQFVKQEPDLRCFNAYMSRLVSKRMPDEAEAKDYVRDGYCSKTDSLKEDLPEVTVKEFEPNEKMIHYLDVLLTELDKRKLNYIMVSHPQPPRKGYDEFHNSFRKVVDPILNAHHVKYIDYTQTPGFITTQHFFDLNHMNQSGVTMFNSMLIDTLEKSGIITPHAN